MHNVLTVVLAIALGGAFILWRTIGALPPATQEEIEALAKKLADIHSGPRGLAVTLTSRENHVFDKNGVAVLNLSAEMRERDGSPPAPWSHGTTSGGGRRPDVAPPPMRDEVTE